MTNPEQHIAYVEPGLKGISTADFLWYRLLASQRKVPEDSRRAWTVKEHIESNLRELCIDCFPDEVIEAIYELPTLFDRLSEAYRLLQGSADEEFRGFELPIPGEGWPVSDDYAELIQQEWEGEKL